MWNTSLPDDVVVSTPSVRLRKPSWRFSSPQSARSDGAGSAQPVQAPDHQGVLAVAELLERPLQLRAVPQRSGGGIAKAAGASRAFERLKLQLVVLIVGGDAGVADEHASIVSKPTDAVASETLVSDTSFGHPTSLLAARSARCLTDGRL